MAGKCNRSPAQPYVFDVRLFLGDDKFFPLKVDVVSPRLLQIPEFQKYDVLLGNKNNKA